MKLFQKLVCMALTATATASLSICAFAADYTFDTAADTDYYPSTLAGLHSGHHDDVADPVQLLANGCMYSPVLPKLVVEVIHLLKLGAYDFHERLDIGLASELLDKVVFQGRYIISHQSPPRSSPPWCRPADAP